MKLPELPLIALEDCLPYDAIRYVPGYPVSFIREYALAYGAASFRAGMERAAAICEQFKANTLAAQQGPSDDLGNLMLRQVGTLGFGEAAAAIRKEAGNG
jgi:hypothetical protein